MSKDVSLSSAMGNDDVMIEKWRPSWILYLGFVDFPKTSGKRRN